MIERARLSPKTKSKSKSMALAPARRRLFGEPQLLEGEDAAVYAELLARVRAALKPLDIIDEIFIEDFVYSQWQALRWRRFQTDLVRMRGLRALEDFLHENLDDDLYQEDLVDDLTEVLEDNLPEGEKDFAQKLAHDYVQDEPDAVDKVNSVLNASNRDADEIQDDARARKAEELVQEYAQRKPGAVTRIKELLAGTSVTLDSLAADALAEEFDYIERLDRQTAIAESRRNAALREMDRRRAVLRQALRESMQEIEDRKVKVIDATPAKRKNAA